MDDLLAASLCLFFIMGPAMVLGTIVLKRIGALREKETDSISVCRSNGCR